MENKGHTEKKKNDGWWEMRIASQTLPLIRDDGGRPKESKAKRDCVVRALAILTGEPYDEILEYARLLIDEYVVQHPQQARRLQGFPVRTGMLNFLIDKLYADYGLLKAMDRYSCNMRIDTAHAQFGDCIVLQKRHAVCIKDGATRDTFDSTHTYRNNLRWCKAVWVQ